MFSPKYVIYITYSIDLYRNNSLNFRRSLAKTNYFVFLIDILSFRALL